MKEIKIEETFKVPGTNIILEKGDMIKVQEAANPKDVSSAAELAKEIMKVSKVNAAGDRDGYVRVNPLLFPGERKPKVNPTLMLKVVDDTLQFHQVSTHEGSTVAKAIDQHTGFEATAINTSAQLDVVSGSRTSGTPFHIPMNIIDIGVIIEAVIAGNNTYGKNFADYLAR